MFILHARNAHKALPEGIRLLGTQGYQRDSRNGPVLVMPAPVTTVFAKPLERVLFWPERDANPFFHLMEALWMLGGRNDVGFVSHYVSTMRQYSDDGKTLHGAYGYRWRRHFDVEGGGRPGLPDQLATIIDILTKNPDDRRCVLTMWDPVSDLGREGKDFPCNTHAYFSRGQRGELNMTVCNRSNDIIYGLYGANVVHFSILQEFVACAIGCAVGAYTHISNNYHGYLETYTPLAHLADQTDDYNGHRKSPYETGEVGWLPLMTVDRKTWEEDLALFLTEGPIVGFRDPFFRRVATPMYWAFEHWKRRKDYDGAIEVLQQCAASDWRKAGTEWLQRRKAKAARAADDGVHA